MQRTVGIILPEFVLAAPTSLHTIPYRGDSVEEIHFRIRQEFVGKPNMRLEDYPEGRVVQLQSRQLKTQVLLQTHKAVLNSHGEIDVTAYRYTNLPLAWVRGGDGSNDRSNNRN